ncbi:MULTISPECIES: hypothetical protein [unclassified Mycoplasma]|uniref:hypothetical protein n=1 Tax=unclassified Mycoplasma TaxID=2683645 RepID=UPI00211CC9B2|nr:MULTISPECIES: hypothetical protein [unclassified Mycoplasma]UUM19707.1 hypothetical protein NPA11_02970 [Mycoplasma sp. 1578d]UUM24690.1 hypothetical protein NPA12_03265 [Mycoplasma sp. 3686d]
MDIKIFLKNKEKPAQKSDSKLDPEHLINLRKAEIARIIAQTYDSSGNLLPEKSPEELLAQAKARKRALVMNLIYISIIVLVITLLFLGAYAISIFAG